MGLSPKWGPWSSGVSAQVGALAEVVLPYSGGSYLLKHTRKENQSDEATVHLCFPSHVSSMEQESGSHLDALLSKAIQEFYEETRLFGTAFGFCHCGSLTETIGNSFRPHFADLQALLLKCLQDETSNRVRVAALKAVGSFLEFTNDGPEVVGKGYWLCIAGLDSCFGKASDDGESFEEVIVDSMSKVVVCWKGQFGSGHGSCMFCCVLENASLSWEASWALARLDSSRKSLTCVCDQFPEDVAVIAFEIFDELIESPAPLLGESVKSIVQFALEVCSSQIGIQHTSSESTDGDEDDDLAPDRAAALKI
ncbi:putative importin subunit beta-4 [Fagus crenata]